jgi:hypothetical protein
MRKAILVGALLLAGCGDVHACGWELIVYDNTKDQGKLAPPRGACSLVVVDGPGLAIVDAAWDGCVAEPGPSCRVLLPGEAVEVWARGEWQGEARAGLAALAPDGSCPLACE